MWVYPDVTQRCGSWSTAGVSGRSHTLAVKHSCSHSLIHVGQRSFTSLTHEIHTEAKQQLPVAPPLLLEKITADTKTLHSEFVLLREKERTRERERVCPGVFSSFFLSFLVQGGGCRADGLHRCLHRACTVSSMSVCACVCLCACVYWREAKGSCSGHMEGKSRVFRMHSYGDRDN